MTTSRAELITAFLATSGWGSARVEPLAGDASNRRYLRLTGPAGRAVLMDAPPQHGEDVRPFVFVTNWLRAHGLSAPELLAADAPSGLLLLEDLGDSLFASHLRTASADEHTLYESAVRLLVRLADVPAPPDLPPYDREPLDREAALFTEWWLPGAAGPVSPAMADEYGALIRNATAAVEGTRDIAVLRDYHAENLIWLPDRAGAAKVGLLDYQDALLGHAAYDLVSLLEDARRDTSKALQDAMIALYLAERPKLDPEAFRLAYATLGAQRNLKIIGIFARLALRDRKPRYLGLIPRVWAHLQNDLSHPALAPLRAWVMRRSPAPEPQVLARLAAAVPA